MTRRIIYDMTCEHALFQRGLAQMALAILDRRVQTAPPKAQARDIIGATRIAESCARIADPCARVGLVLGDRATVLAPACL